MDLTADTGVAARCVGYMLEQDKERPHVIASAQLVGNELQATRDVLQAIWDSKILDNAVGVQLDAAGWIVGEPRLGRADDLYRQWIRVRIIVNRTNGKIDDSLRVMRLLVESTATLQYTYAGPAGYILRNTNSAFDPVVLRQVLDLVRPAGVRMQLHTTPDATMAFTLSDVADTSLASTLGLGDTGSPTFGGIMTSSF